MLRLRVVPPPLVCGDLVAPEVDPLAVEPLDAPEPVEVLPEVVDEDAIEGLAAAPAAAPDAVPPPPPVAACEPVDGFGGEVPAAGMPVSGAVQAHARLAPTTAVASIAKTANEKRLRLVTSYRLVRSDPSYSWFAPDSR